MLTRFLLSIVVLSLFASSLVNCNDEEAAIIEAAELVLLGTSPKRSSDVVGDATVTELTSYDERQARMSLHTESPRAKARREQALRNILVARRRKVMLRHRPSSSETLTAAASSRRSSLRRKPVVRETMVGDVLEMQESQNGLYVTVPEQQQHQSINDTHEIVIETLGGGTTGTTTGNSLKRNATSSSSGNPSKAQRSSQHQMNTGSSMEQRGKKIVEMPASLYNHFRPVESNIPIEDMSQFLYFGQKLRGTGMGKDSSPASPSPKKLLAILDDEMNSVDRSSSHVSASKSTKMRTTSLREQPTSTSTTSTSTAKPSCPDKAVSDARGNSINATNAEKNSEASSSTANLSLRIVVTEATMMTPSTVLSVQSSTTTTTTTTTTSAASSTVVSSTTTEDADSSTVGNKEPQSQSESQSVQHVTEAAPSPRQRTSSSALRNSSHQTGSAPITVSSPAASAPRPLSAGATVEQAAAPPRASQRVASTAAHKQQPGFTIRWTDARPVSKRRRLAAAAAANRRRDKSARTMDDQTTATTTTLETSATLLPVDPKINLPELTSETIVTSSSSSSSTTLSSTTSAADTEEPEVQTTETDVPTTTTTIGRMLDPSEVQKMYRSGSTSTTTTTTTTMTSSAVPSTEMIEEATTDTTTVSSSASSTSAPTSASSPVPERSPEVRARNLADKAKDDVLPIMQLYNTSSMFNASEAPSTTTTTVLPTELIVEPTTPTATTTIVQPSTEPSTTSTTTTARPTSSPRPVSNNSIGNKSSNRTGSAKPHRREFPGEYAGYYPYELNNGIQNNSLNRTFLEPPGFVSVGSSSPIVNISEVISRRHDADALASQETVAVVSYILATLVVFPIAVGVGLILRRLILRNRKVLEESDTSSEISCRKDALNLETGDFKMPIEKTITKLPRIHHLCHEAEKPPPPSSQESRWEFPRDKLRLQTVLGEGNFGQVWKAEADDLTGHQGTTRLVAVKTVKEGASDREKEDLVRELEIMQRVGSHPNVVTLLGCCTEQEPHYLILEYVMYGKLLAYLRDHRTRQDFYNFSEDSAALTSRDLTVFGYCVARGMEYLASKKIIHRDLAARNVLVDHNKLCKIADFGMSRFANEDGEVIETRHGRNALPIRWMAPESLIYSLFTTKTDVWSFGILMWEIVTLGSTPYPDMTAREVMRSVQSGYRLERPSHCRSELFRVIARCWHADPDRRPEFPLLRRDLAQLLEDNMNGHYVDLESFASECTD